MSNSKWEVERVVSTLENAASLLESAAAEVRRYSKKYEERNDDVYIVSAMSTIINLLPNVRLDMFLTGALYVERSEK